MTNKIISIILSLLLVIGLIPSAVAMAEDASPISVIYQEDFTNFNVASYNSSYNASSTTFDLNNNDGTKRLGIGNYFKADIVNMPGYDGELTNALKVTINPDLAKFDSTAGAGRITFPGMSSSGLPGTKTDGALVYELKLYTPEANSDGTRKDLSSFVMSPIVKAGASYGVGNSSTDKSKRTLIGDMVPGEWVSLKYVLLLNENKVLVYCDDKLVSYKEREVTSKGYQFQIQARRNVADEHIIFDDFKVWHIAGKSADDISPQCITLVSSILANAEKVSATVKPSVEFSEMLLPRAGVTTDNVVITDENGTELEVESVTVADDKKSIVIKPSHALEQGTEYNVKVTGLYDMYDQLIPDYEFSFTTKPQEFTVSQTEFSVEAIGGEGTSNAISSLENGYVNANYSVKNNSTTETKQAFMFAVLREGRKLKSIQFKTVTLAPLSTDSFNAGFTIDDYENQSIETYVWDSLSGKVALGSSYTITADGVTTTLSE